MLSSYIAAPQKTGSGCSLSKKVNVQLHSLMPKALINDGG